MKNKENNISQQSNILEEEAAKYGHSEAVETERRRQAILSTPSEKFKVLMTLMKLNEMMKRAKIHHKPDF